jgi:hypothetical protein
MNPAGRRQSGEVSTSTAVVLTLLVLGAIAWWVYSPETIPFIGHRPEPARAATAAAPHSTRAADSNPPLYKWRDEHEQWHITDQPPKDRPYERVVPNPDTNVLPSMDSERAQRELDAKAREQPPH